MKIRFVFKIATLVLAAALAAQTPQALLKSAIDKEMVDGDLKGAIVLYEKAVAVAKTDRATAARALIRMAECHERLGHAEAKTIYERVAREFADQKDAAATARGKLRAEAGPIARQVWGGPGVRVGGSVSADGRWSPFRDRAAGNLMLRDIVNGTERILAKASTEAGSPDLSTISPNGRLVAYVWLLPGGGSELRMVETAGSRVPTPRLLYKNPDVRYPGPWAWSPDSQTIGVQVQRADRTVQLGLLSVKDGSLRILKSVGWGRAHFMTISPDGKYLAYSVNNETLTRHTDINVIALDGSRENTVIADPNSDDRPQVWSLDGRYLLFASNRGGRDGLWALPVKDGAAAGKPSWSAPVSQMSTAYPHPARSTTASTPGDRIW